MVDILISGYHGYANSGDDALLRAVIDALKAEKPDVKIAVLSARPKETAEIFGVPAIHRYRYFSIARAMRRAKLLIFGGGSLLQDVTSTKSLYYYLTVLRMAQHRKVKTMLSANGIGPLVHPSNRKVTAKVLNRVDAITLRDDTSDQELKRMKVENPHIKITADPVFGLNLDDFRPDRSIAARAGLPEGAPYMVVAVRPWKYAEKNFPVVIAKACDEIMQKYGIAPLFLSMQSSVDLPLAEDICAKMKEQGYLMRETLSLEETLSLVSGATVSIGMRLHTLIYATVLMVPSMALVYDPKVSAFMKSVNQPLCVKVETITAEETIQKLTRLIDERDERKADLAITNQRLKEKAKENAQYAIRLLEE